MSEDRTAWDARARASIDGLAPLRFLVGRFEGQGQDHGAPIRAEAEGLLRLDGSWLELRERLREPDGTLLYEDFALYRFDPVDGQLRVMHFSARAWLSRYPARVDTEGALHWTTGVGGPKVVLEPAEGGWRSRVTLPDEKEPAVVLQYRAVESDR